MPTRRSTRTSCVRGCAGAAGRRSAIFVRAHHARNLPTLAVTIIIVQNSHFHRDRRNHER